MSFKRQIKRPVLFTIVGLGRLRLTHGSPKPIDVGRIKSILVVQLGGIGDVLLIFPLLRQLKKAFPDKSLCTVTEYGDWLFELAPDLSAGITHQRLDLSLDYRGKLRQIRAISKEGIDLAISTARGDGVVETSLVAWLTGAKVRIGYCQEGSRFLYTHTCDFSYAEPIVRQNLDMLRLLQCPSTDAGLGLEIAKHVEDKAKALIKQTRNSGGPAIVLHPFAGNFAEFKSWPMTRYAHLAARLIDEHAASVMILGSATERALWEGISPPGHGQWLENLCGRVSFQESAAIIKHADLFIGNDSSLLHLAESFGTPAIGIFGATSPGQMLPKGHGTAVVRRDLRCSPCYLHQPLHVHRCLAETPVKCLQDIDVGQVLKIAADKLAHPGGNGRCALP